MVFGSSHFSFFSAETSSRLEENHATATATTMANRSAPPRSVPPQLSDLLPLEQHLEDAAEILSRDLAALKNVVSALEKEAGQAAAEAASARELARAAEASAAASSVLNSELRGKLVSLANEAAEDSELLASATADAGRVREELASAARKVASAEAAAASSEARAREVEQLTLHAQRETSELAREAEEARGKAAAALAREKAAADKSASLEKRLADERKVFQESMASFGARGQFGGMSRGWGK